MASNISQHIYKMRLVNRLYVSLTSRTSPHNTNTTNTIGNSNNRNLILNAREESTKNPIYASTSSSSKRESRRHFTNRNGSIQDVEISQRLRLIKAGNSNGWSYATDPEKILVVFLPWLNSKEKHIQKYVQLYLDVGLDVLCVKSTPKDFLWPPTSFNLARELSEVLKEQTNYDHYLFHSMSIGSYNLTTFRALGKDVQEVSDLNSKICGIIYDSIVIGAGRGGALASKTETDEDNSKAIDRFIKGIVGSVKGGSIIMPLASLLAKIYFSLTKKQTLDYYERAYSIVRDEPANVPTLLFASENDPMCDKEVVNVLVHLWKNDHNIPVTLKMWDVSGHAQHLSFHRKEYIQTFRTFLDNLFENLDHNKTSKGKANTRVNSKL